MDFECVAKMDFPCGRNVLSFDRDDCTLIMFRFGANRTRQQSALAAYLLPSSVSFTLRADFRHIHLGFPFNPRGIHVHSGRLPAGLNDLSRHAMLIVRLLRRMALMLPIKVNAYCIGIRYESKYGEVLRAPKA